MLRIQSPYAKTQKGKNIPKTEFTSLWTCSDLGSVDLRKLPPQSRKNGVSVFDTADEWLGGLGEIVWMLQFTFSLCSWVFAFNVELLPRVTLTKWLHVQHEKTTNELISSTAKADGGKIRRFSFPLDHKLSTTAYKKSQFNIYIIYNTHFNNSSLNIHCLLYCLFTIYDWLLSILGSFL